MPGTYFTAKKEDDLEIVLHIPPEMEINKMWLEKLGFQDKGQLALRLKKGLYSLKTVETVVQLDALRDHNVFGFQSDLYR